MIQPILLHSLIGKQMQWASHAANMRQFGFCQLSEQSNVDTWNLHIQCSWRLCKNDSIITGSFDWFEPDEAVSDGGDEWEPVHGGSLQDKRLRELLQDSNSKGLILNKTGLLVVERCDQDVLGGLVMGLTIDVRLEIFPAGTKGEYWRLFRKDDDESHYVSEAALI